MARYIFVLLQVLLIVRAHSLPLTTDTAPDVRRAIVDFIDDGFLDTYPNSHDHYSTFSTYWTSSFSYGGLFPDESQTRTDDQSQTASTAATTGGSARETRHPAKATAAPSATTPTAGSSVPSASPTSGPNAAEAASMSSGEAKQWKIIGLIVICITFVGVAILTVVFFDQWWGFLRDLVSRRRRRDGKEDMVPDWEHGSWEYKIQSPNEDGLRYPKEASSGNIKRDVSAGSMGGMGGMGMGPASGAGVGTGMGMGMSMSTGMGMNMGRGAGMVPEPLMNPFESYPRDMQVSPQPFYDPRPLEPIARRPSNHLLSPHGYA
ncbi:hypothetical protein LshimejAT787_0301200 [Lyophyllum shimeji]|uniref:Transmembrane protein n=1 Tax=Lyophyllum shimeji TaxID=47721 RepID=A0A9P3UJW7_LYOSH|nr:hypothetical protein LshimejAT787_0301200 [Lyophyllum shimeji]